MRPIASCSCLRDRSSNRDHRRRSLAPPSIRGCASFSPASREPDSMEGFASNFLNWSVARDYMSELMAGMAMTLKLAIVVNICGLVAGTVLALIRSLRVGILSALVVLFADVVRALPPLMLMIVVYFGLPFLGLKLNGFAVVSIVLAAILASFTEELLWAGLAAIAQSSSSVNDASIAASTIDATANPF